MTAAPSEHARAAYDALAPGYDDLTSGHDHAAWTEFLERLAVDAGLRGNRVLDVACGTGNTVLPMLRRGYTVTGVDISGEMIAQARAKAGARARLLRHDMRMLPVLGRFDLVWCLGDALNYLDGRGELTAAFAGFRRNLAAGGVVVFDVNTLATFRVLYASVLAVPSDDRVVLLDGRGSPDLPAGGTAWVWIDRLERAPTGSWSRVRSVHRHRHHPEAEVRTALAAAGLTVASVHGTFPTGEVEQPMDDLRHAKAVYTARLGAPRPTRGR